MNTRMRYVWLFILGTCIVGFMYLTPNGMLRSSILIGFMTGVLAVIHAWNAPRLRDDQGPLLRSALFISVLGGVLAGVALYVYILIHKTSHVEFYGEVEKTHLLQLASFLFPAIIYIAGMTYAYLLFRRIGFYTLLLMILFGAIGGAVRGLFQEVMRIDAYIVITGISGVLFGLLWGLLVLLINPLGLVRPGRGESGAKRRSE